MYAFGDGLLFIFVFGGASALPTGVALYFLRKFNAFWLLLSIVALAVSATGLGAVVAIVDPYINASYGIWSALAVPEYSLLHCSPCYL
jgi:hypothetical protein